LPLSPARQCFASHLANVLFPFMPPLPCLHGPDVVLMSVRHKKDTHMGSGAFITGVPGTSGSYFMPEPMGFQVTSKFGMALHVSCVHRSFVRIILPLFFNA